MRARINVSLTPAEGAAVSVAYDPNLALAVQQRRAPTEQL
jgi:hypothetical protein